MSFKAKGKAYERKLVQILKENGWKSRRIPASILDVIATKGERLAVFEVKFTKRKKIKIIKDAGVEMALRGMFSYYVGAEGTPNIMRIIIAREILGREFLPYRD